MTKAGFGDGIDFAVQQLAVLDREVPAQLPAATLAAVEVLRDAARANAPKRTGKMANAITAEAVDSDATSARSRVKVGMFYARFVEYGTVKMAARPFLRAAAELNRRRMGNVIKDEIRVIGISIRSFKA